MKKFSPDMSAPARWSSMMVRKTRRLLKHYSNDMVLIMFRYQSISIIVIQQFAQNSDLRNASPTVRLPRLAICNDTVTKRPGRRTLLFCIYEWLGDEYFNFSRSLFPGPPFKRDEPLRAILPEFSRSQKLSYIAMLPMTNSE